MTSLIHLFHNSTVCVMNSQVSGQCLYTRTRQNCMQITKEKLILNNISNLFSSILLSLPRLVERKPFCYFWGDLNTRY